MDRDMNERIQKAVSDTYNMFGLCEEKKCSETLTYADSIERSIERAKSVLLAKKNEYATDDHFHNFRVAAALQGKPMKEALSGMMAKHTVSVYDMCCSGKTYPMEMWDEKITDHINYLLILRALIDMEGDNV